MKFKFLGPAIKLQTVQNVCHSGACHYQNAVTLVADILNIRDRKATEQEICSVYLLLF